MSGYLEGLKQAVEQLHSCKAIFLESVPVHEVFQGQTVWEGMVEVFAIEGHPKAKKCYVWGHSDGKEIFAVLEIPPVDSAKTAVQIGIVSRKG